MVCASQELRILSFVVQPRMYRTLAGSEAIGRFSVARFTC